MFQHILIATDGSELATKALEHGLALAKSLGCKVTIATVTDRWPLVEVAAQAEMGEKDPIGHYASLAEQSAQAVLGAARKFAVEAGVAVEELHIKQQHPAEGIVAAARQSGADLIIVASHGRRGINQLLLGSVANEITTKSDRSVLVVR